MERKAPAVADLAGTRFHLIGHLQSNKTKKGAQLFSTVDSVDSVKLAARLDSGTVPLDVMIEVKLSAEAAKTERARMRWARLWRSRVRRASRHLKLTGLMTVPPWSEDAELSRPYFARLVSWPRRFTMCRSFRWECRTTWRWRSRKGGNLGSRRHGALRPPETGGVTVGYHAPPPGSLSGIADYAETLKRALGRLGALKAARIGPTFIFTTWATTGCMNRFTLGRSGSLASSCCTTPC